MTTPWLQQKLPLTAVFDSGESCVLSVGIACLTNNNAKFLQQQQQRRVSDKQIWKSAWNQTN